MRHTEVDNNHPADITDTGTTGGTIETIRIPVTEKQDSDWLLRNTFVTALGITETEARWIVWLKGFHWSPGVIPPVDEKAVERGYVEVPLTAQSRQLAESVLPFARMLIGGGRERMRKLERSPGLYKKYREYVEMRDMLLLAAGVSKGPVSFESLIPYETAFRTALAASPYKTQEEYAAEVQWFRDEFFPATAQNAGMQMLFKSRNEVLAEKGRYATSDAPPVTTLVKELSVLEQYKEDRIRLADMRLDAVLKGGGANSNEGIAEFNRWTPLFNALDRQQQEFLDMLAAEYPILRAFPHKYQLREANTPEKLHELFSSTIDTTLDNIEEIWKELIQDKDLIWDLDIVMAKALVDLEIGESSDLHAIVSERAEKERANRDLRDAIIGFIGIALFAFSRIPGIATWLSRLALGAAAATDLAALALHLREYQQQKSAAGTAFDKASALSSNDPTLVPVVLDLLAFGLSAADIWRALRSLRNPMQGVPASSNPAVTGPEGAAQFTIYSLSAPLSKNMGILEALMRIGRNDATIETMIAKYGREKVEKIADLVAGRSEMKKLVAQRGEAAVDALIRSDGDLKKALGALGIDTRGLKLLPAQGETVITVEEGLARVAELRKALKAGRTRNIAFAEFSIDGRTGEYVAVSGEAPRKGAVGMPGSRMFTTIVVEHSRHADSEVKILEELASQLSPGSTGVIRLFSELPVCESCVGVIGQFKSRFPNIKIIVSAGPEL